MEERRLKKQLETPPKRLKAHRLPPDHLQPWSQDNLSAKGVGHMALGARANTMLSSRLLQNASTAWLFLLLPVQSR